MRTDEELLAAVRSLNGTRGHAWQRKKTKNMRLELLSEPGLKRCKYCKCVLTLASATVDHIIPISKGGRTIRSNCALACGPCNNEKGNS